MKKYAVLNNENGEHDYYDTKEEAISAFWTRVINYALTHFHGTVYTSIEIDSNGAEMWKNDCDEVIDKILSASEITALAEEAKKQAKEKAAKIATPVEVWP